MLYPLGDTPEELLENFIAMLALAEEVGFTFQPVKTQIAPRKTIIFGWELEEGCWSPQSHVISSLSRSKKPVTVKQLRSYLGSVKQLSDCLPGHSILLSPFEKIVGSRKSADRITWTPELDLAFAEIQKAVAKPDSVLCPFAF